MRYEGTVYRPPSEAGSLIIQLTIGCARNTCTFCNMYKDKKFRIRPLEEVAEDLEMARKYYSHIKVRRIFLADGDALIVKTKDLLYILDKCHEYFPEVERISVYGAPKDILGKTPEELKQLKDTGLDMVYMGLESGDDDVLKEVKKGVTSEEMIA
ncbi:radical SAM protein, partial [Anaerotignum lactatifermentans]|uniref:radical SAM protein n=1 Tax=Anaerotignum lactatifermentans TaxID=160404 RepID=UPI003AB312FA